VYCLAEAVPNTETDAFQYSPIENATLHVPSESLEAYGAVEPWKSFGSIVALPQKCATPTVAFVNGKLTFSCETEDVEFTYEITNADVKKGSGNEITIGGKYTVSVYATKEGWENSDVATKDIELSVSAVGDVNGDGVIDVSDYIGVANIILTGNILGK
jgi:hypothetical protein